MAEFEVKTISCSSKITAKIEVNISSLDGEYNGNKLDFRKKFIIDSGKGTNYAARLWIVDYGQPQQVQYSSGKMSEFHQKRFCLTIADAQKVDFDMNIVFSESETISEKFSGSNLTGKSFFFDEGKKDMVVDFLVFWMTLSLERSNHLRETSPLNLNLDLR